jgi:hypothetical protein
MSENRHVLVTLVTIASAVVAMLAAVAAGWQAGLIRKQVRHDRDLATATLYQSIAGRFVEIDKFFVDRPQLRPYFYDDEALPADDMLRNQVLASAEMIFDLAECCYASAPVLRGRASDWDQYFGLLYRNSPALRAYAADYAQFYPDAVYLAFLSSSSDAAQSETRPALDSAGEHSS